MVDGSGQVVSYESVATKLTLRGSIEGGGPPLQFLSNGSMTTKELKFVGIVNSSSPSRG